jgi:hypothetical protein
MCLLFVNPEVWILASVCLEGSREMKGDVDEEAHLPPLEYPG